MTALTGSRDVAIPSSLEKGFIVNFQTTTRTNTNNGARRARQAEVQGFITPEGEGTEDCINSTIYNISSDGVLSLPDGGTYSASTGVSSILFAPASDIGNITTAWQFVGNTLRWVNDAFLNNTAAICIDRSTMDLFAYFLELPPDRCTPVILYTAPCQSSPLLY